MEPKWTSFGWIIAQINILGNADSKIKWIL
jgi:hypothetical protein